MMLRDLLAKQDQSSPQQSDDDQRGRQLLGASPAPPHKDAADEDFVPVNHEDVEEVDDGDDDESEMERVLRPFLGLQRQMAQRGGGADAAKFGDLHPYTQILNVSDVNQCVELENAAFPENERCSRDKFTYRLSRCPELSLGLFSRPVTTDSTNTHLPQPGTRADLIGHIIATRTPSPSVTDACMALPMKWQSRRSSLPDPKEKTEPLGHQEQGRTIAVHSLAITAPHQGKGLGKILLKAYVQRIKDSKIADRVALLAHENVVKFYENVGFQNMGPSTAQFGGGGWNDMILEFQYEAEN